MEQFNLINIFMYVCGVAIYQLINLQSAMRRQKQVFFYSKYILGNWINFTISIVLLFPFVLYAENFLSFSGISINTGLGYGFYCFIGGVINNTVLQKIVKK